jgi:hypothetical protein
VLFVAATQRSEDWNGSVFVAIICVRVRVAAGDLWRPSIDIAVGTVPRCAIRNCR